jgi:hypothetical protein
VLGGEGGSCLAISSQRCVGASTQRQLYALGATDFGGIHERSCPSWRIARIDLGTGIEKEPDTRRIPMLGETVERAPTELRILSHRICPCVEQDSHHCKTCFRRIEQGRESLLVSRVDRRPSFQQEGRDLRVVEYSRSMQCCPARFIGLIRIGATLQEFDHEIPLSKCSRPDQASKFVAPIVLGHGSGTEGFIKTLLDVVFVGCFEQAEERIAAAHEFGEVRHSELDQAVLRVVDQTLAYQRLSSLA